MKALRYILPVSGLILFAGCGAKDTESIAVPPPPAAAAVDMNAGAAAVAPAPVAAEVPPPSAGTAALMPAAPAADSEVKITDADGKPIPIIEFMNNAVDNYERTRASQTEGEVWPPITSLEDMVKVGFLKRVPTPPKGQKFVFNPETMKVTLVPN